MYGLHATQSGGHPAINRLQYKQYHSPPVTGQLPFQADTVGELVFHHMTSPVPDLMSVNANIPQHLSDTEVIRQDSVTKARLKLELSEFAGVFLVVAPAVALELSMATSAESTHELSDRRIAVALAT